MAGARRLSDLVAALRERVRSRVPAGPIVVALSGGPDSAVCAWLVHDLGGAVRAVFIDHGFPESALMERAAVDVAKTIGIELDRIAVSVDPRGSREAAARAARYRALYDALQPEEWLATGHTADDNAETILANLLRGSGATGLAGIPSVRDRIVRPLLDVWRSEVHELAVHLDLPAGSDPANLDAAPLRNRLRRELLPFLEARYDSKVRHNLHRASRHLSADDAALDAAAGLIPVRQMSDRVRVPYPPVVTAPPAVAARVVRRALRLLHPPYSGSSADVAATLAVAAGAPPVVIGGGVRVTRNGPFLDFTAGVRSSWRGRLEIPGAIDGPGLHVESWITTTAPNPWPLGRSTAVVDAAAVGPALELRGATAEDTVVAGGHEQPVREMLRDAGVAPELRSGWPVAVARGKLVWVVAVRAADWVRPGSDTTEWLWLQARMEAW